MNNDFTHLQKYRFNVAEERLEDFGLNVAKERIKQNISAYELSLRLGKDTSYVNKLENGKINVSLKMIIALAQALNVPIEKLFD